MSWLASRRRPVSRTPRATPRTMPTGPNSSRRPSALAASVGRCAPLRRDAALQGDRGPGSGGPGPLAAAGPADRGGLRRPAAHGRRRVERLGRAHGAVGGPGGRRRRDLPRGPGGRGRHRRDAVRRGEPVGPPRGDLPAGARAHPRLPRLPGRARHRPLRRGHLHRLPLVRGPEAAGPVPVRTWPVIHVVRVWACRAVERPLDAGRRPPRAHPGHQHRRPRRAARSSSSTCTTAARRSGGRPRS